MSVGIPSRSNRSLQKLATITTTSVFRKILNDTKVYEERLKTSKEQDLMEHLTKVDGTMCQCVLFILRSNA